MTEQHIRGVVRLINALTNVTGGRDHLRAEVERLTAALEPFARISRENPRWADGDTAYLDENDRLTAADFHRARRVLDEQQWHAARKSPDIVVRLREPVMLRYDAEAVNAERREAADEIERLRAADGLRCMMERN